MIERKPEEILERELGYESYNSATQCPPPNVVKRNIVGICKELDK